MALNKLKIYNGVKIGLGICVVDAAVSSQIEHYTDSAIDFFGTVKGLANSVLESPSGIQLITIYVNDVWRGSGEFKFSPATDILFDALMTHNRGLPNA